MQFCTAKKKRNKKANFERNQLQYNTKNAKEQWEVLQSIGLPSKAAQISKICLKENNFTQIDEKQSANRFFYSEIASIAQSFTQIVEKAPTGKNIFEENSVEQYYSAMNIPSNSYKFRNAKHEEIYKILMNVDPNEAFDIDIIPGRFLKDGLELLTEPLYKIISL